MFPTILYKGMICEHREINDVLKKALRHEKKMDSVGLIKSNQGGWHSKGNLHKQDPFTQLVKLIETFSRSISEEWGYSKSHDIAVTSMWGMINKQGAFNMSHTHPGALWSGVYYLQTPEECGDINFEDPRAVAVATAGIYEKGNKRPECAWSKVRFTPEEGDFYIFPSWLRHYVEPNFSIEKGNKAQRIIISFNLEQRNAL